MTLNRRNFLIYCTASIVNMYSPLSLSTQISTRKQIFISAASDNTGNHYISSFDQKGNEEFIYHSSYRGHSFAVNHSKSLIFSVSRRPGTTIDIINIQGKRRTQIKARKNRHFYGHAVCSKVDELLYTTENNLETGNGVIGVRKASYPHHVIGEFPTYGIGPHDITLSTDQRYIIVANGGVKTHPQTGRKKLNIPTMKPSLVFIDRHNGKLMREAYLPKPYHLNSIRHITVNSGNDVFIALQNQSPQNNKNEVLLAHYYFADDTMSVITIPESLQTQLQGYLGSIALDTSETILAATSPRGGYIVFYNVKTKVFFSQKIDDVSGIQAGGKLHEFWVTTGNGDIGHCHINQAITYTTVKKNSSLQWDNHLFSL